MNYPREISRIVFRPSIIAFGDAIEFIGQNRAADMFLVVHENEHYVSIMRRSDKKQAFVHIHNVNVIEYREPTKEPINAKPEFTKDAKRQVTKSKTGPKLV